MKELLVVDDEQQMLVAIEETLKRKGFSVTTATNGMDAVGKLRNHFYQAVITDVRMPELSGLDLLKQIKKLSPSTPVILLTGHGTVTDAVTALKQGAYDYLMKPFSARELTDVVDKATRGSLEEPTSGDVEIVTNDPAMRQLLEMASQAAQSDTTVLVEAESGTGKELIARFIHSCSSRRENAFVAVNCAALPDELLESELFGHEKGAFTGALSRKIGKFELAHRGTILLDEIGEMVPRLQAKLLRVLQEKEIDRVGGLSPTRVDVRVIATTNRNLKELVNEGQFREDLYYRLNVIPLTIPPLRERKKDIPLLANHFCNRFGREGQSFAQETLDLLQKYHWPGNVRELENVTRRALALSRNPVISPGDLFLNLDDPTQASIEVKAGISLKEIEKEVIRVTLRETEGNRTHAARMLGVSLRTLRNKLREYREQGEIL
ncbi:MAG TPA: sigma-54 dependent transcriptional regulator [Acidobacteriota bacterium]|nr:sigma-54 dependent transcriptional regulator [Acidobacteriota bacterium]